MNEIVNKGFEEFFKENQALLHAALRPYRGLDEYDDLFCIGTIGFWKGFVTYRLESKTKKTTYIYKCIVNEVRCHLRKSRAKSRTAAVISMDAPIGGDNQTRLIDLDSKRITASDEPSDMDEQVFDRLLFEVAINILENEMLPHERYIVWQFLKGTPQTKTALELGVSQSKISKILKHTLQQLRVRLAEMGFCD